MDVRFSIPLLWECTDAVTGCPSHLLLWKWTWQSPVPQFDESFHLPPCVLFTRDLKILYESREPQFLLLATGLILLNPRIDLCIFLSEVIWVREWRWREEMQAMCQTMKLCLDSIWMEAREIILMDCLATHFFPLQKSLLLSKYIFSLFFCLVNISFMFALNTLFLQFSRDWCL